MTTVLQQAIHELEQLPEATQERIGRDILSNVDAFRALRADISQAIQSLDHGASKQLDINEVIKRARSKHGQS